MVKIKMVHAATKKQWETQFQVRFIRQEVKDTVNSLQGTSQQAYKAFMFISQLTMGLNGFLDIHLTVLGSEQSLSIFMVNKSTSA